MALLNRHWYCSSDQTHTLIATPFSAGQGQRLAVPVASEVTLICFASVRVINNSHLFWPHLTLLDFGPPQRQPLPLPRMSNLGWPYHLLVGMLIIRCWGHGWREGEREREREREQEKKKENDLCAHPQILSTSAKTDRAHSSGYSVL